MAKVCESSLRRNSLLVIFLLFSVLLLSGCGPKLSSAEQIRKFNRVGAISHLQDEQEEIQSKYDCVYRVEPGDVLKLTMPSTLQELSWETARRSLHSEPYFCRVNQNGTISLPVVGLVPVAGKTPSEIEAAIVNAHYPKYVVQPPAVVCDIEEHHNERNFAVMGLVRKPDSFEYPPNAQFTLTDALAKAGGTDPVSDPHYATIYRQDTDGEIVAATFKIDRKNFAEASKVLIEPGDIISVDSTFRTGLNRGLDGVLHFGIGASANIAP